LLIVKQIISGNVSYHNLKSGTLLVKTLCEQILWRDKQLIDFQEIIVRAIENFYAKSEKDKTFQTPEYLYNAKERLFVENMSR
jgi:hypothetical protein